MRFFIVLGLSILLVSCKSTNQYLNSYRLIHADMQDSSQIHSGECVLKVDTSILPWSYASPTDCMEKMLRHDRKKMFDLILEPDDSHQQSVEKKAIQHIPLLPMDSCGNRLRFSQSVDGHFFALLYNSPEELPMSQLYGRFTCYSFYFNEQSNSMECFSSYIIDVEVSSF